MESLRFKSRSQNLDLDLASRNLELEEQIYRKLPIFSMIRNKEKFYA
ncbi:hypothetical protein BMS3Abin14_01920 [bacterium BMS3Abin14]|nr:hypothetical protein BMS3Abin14_01920 [bacterium BMS3Abin14]